MPQVRYILCFDTDEYAGNFERELTAYCTGILGDCGVGEDKARCFEEDYEDLTEESKAKINKIPDLILQVPDDHACCRPCAIVPTPGWVNNGMGQFHRGELTDPITEEDNEKYRQAWRDYKLPQLNRYREQFAKGSFPQELLDVEERAYAALDEIKLQYWCDAYLSVGIFFSEIPDPDVLDYMIHRAIDFLTSNKINLECVRVIKEETVVTSTTVQITRFQ